MLNILSDFRNIFQVFLIVCRMWEPIQIYDKYDQITRMKIFNFYIYF